MTIDAVDLGLVSATDELVRFYTDVFALETLEPRAFPFATVHRLAFGPVTLKIMVPSTPPAAAPHDAQFWDRAGIRYITLWVDDLDAVTVAWRDHGGTVSMPPTEIRPGVRTALLLDLDGNTAEVMEQRG